MAVNIYLGAGPSGEEDTIKKDGDPHSERIWRLSDTKNPKFIYTVLGAQTKKCKRQKKKE